jgi:hypothetical protein
MVSARVSKECVGAVEMRGWAVDGAFELWARIKAMEKISSAEAFLIFGKWRDEKSQVQLGISERNKLPRGTPAVITEISEQDETVDAVIVLNGQGQPCRLNFRGTSFQYGEPADSAGYPEFAEGKWVSYLHAVCPSGNEYVFAERFTAK